jgi:hypothetical protein
MEIPEHVPVEFTDQPMADGLPVVTPSGEVVAMYSREWVREINAYHAPDAEALQRIAAVREATESFMNAIIENVADCGDRDKALECARMARLSATSGIALKAMV